MQDLALSGSAASPGSDLEHQVLEFNRQEAAFLARMRDAVLATVSADGSPQATPVWYHWDGSVVRISSPRGMAKVRNIRRQPRVCVCIDDASAGTYISMFGVAEIIEGDAVAAQTQPILLKYLHEDEAAVRWARINAKGDRVVILVRPDKMVSRQSVH
jgi:PPOX class probable F420-dependent enzyme